MDRDHFYKKALPRLREHWAALAAAENQEGGRALTRAEEKKLNSNSQPTNENTSTLFDNPVQGTSTGGFTGPPQLKAYKKTSKKNIVSIYYLFRCTKKKGGP